MTRDSSRQITKCKILNDKKDTREDKEDMKDSEDNYYKTNPTCNGIKFEIQDDNWKRLYTYDMKYGKQDKDDNWRQATDKTNVIQSYTLTWMTM